MEEINFDEPPTSMDASPGSTDVYDNVVTGFPAANRMREGKKSEGNDVRSFYDAFYPKAKVRGLLISVDQKLW